MGINQIVPLSSSHNQEFTITLQINDENVPLRDKLRWNKTAGYWVWTLEDVKTGVMLFDSIPLVTGKVGTKSLGILGGFIYMQIGQVYIVPNSTKPTTDYPNEKNLGSEFLMI